MKKRINLLLILLSFSLLISVNLTYAQTGTCLRKTTNFCQQTTIEQCCGTNQECREKLFYAGISPANTGLCNYPVSCCIDTCSDAQVYGIYSPFACSNQSSFVQKSCNEFSECKVGCAFCSGDTRAIGVYKLKDASAECIRLGKTLSYFNDSVTTSTACNALTQPITETFTVSGSVVITGTQTGISGANVFIAGKSAITDANGNFDIKNVAKGNHTITAIADFYEINYTVINLIQNITNYQINLSKLNNATLEVTVLNSTGQIVPDAIVEISKEGFYQKLATASDGKTMFRYVPFGKYTITAIKGGFNGTGNVDISEAKQYNITITLGAAPVIAYSNITGVISDSSGAVVNNANITLSGPTTVSTLSSNGAYEFRNIPSGTYTATITPPSEFPLLPLTSVIILTAGANTQDFTLQPVGAEFISITFQIKQTDGTPIPNARIKIRQITAATSVEVVTNETGGYEIQLQRTSYEITIIKEGFNALVDTIDLSTITAPTTLTFLLSPAARVAVFGTVKNADGSPISSSYVYLEGLVATITPTFAITDGNGYYRLENLPPGNYTLTASKTGYVDQSFLINLDTDKEQNFILTTRECNVQVIKPEIKRIELKRDKVEIEFMSSCEATGAYIYRCEMIGSECDMKPITNILSPEITSYVDYNIKPDATYFYEVRTVHEKPYVQMIASDKKTISTGHPSCFFETGEFCLNNTRYRCDANNTLQEIADAKKSADAICRYKKDNPQITEYVRKLNCTTECSKPLGMFASFGSLTIPLSTPPLTTTQKCDASEDEVKDKFPENEILSCYKDYTATAVDKFYSCSEVSSCYDYKSEAACKANRCLHKTECEWKSYPTTENLGLGVCRPVNTTLQDCNFCNFDKYNNLFGICSSEICDLYAKKTENSGCYFEQVSKKCLNEREMSCEYYGRNETQCIGENPARNVSVDIYGTNKILQFSNDSLGLGLCKFNSTFASDRCFKDANNDSRPDSNPTDTKPPFTVIEHETAAKAIDFPVFVYDDEDFNSTIMPISTKFFVGTTFVGQSPGIPYHEAENGRIVDYSIPNGIWNVYFFSEDNANNLEVIKSFKILIDAIKPNITASAEQIGKTGTVKITLDAIDYPDTTKLIRCSTSLEDSRGNILQPGTRINPDIAFKGEKTETFSGLKDGIYTYRYNCKDWVGNEISGSMPILVDTEQLITIITPNGTVSSADSIEISTVLDATCYYAISSDLSANINPTTMFDNTGKTLHSALISVAENNTYKLFAKCRITTPTGEIRETNIKQNFFTIDRQKPYTNITIPQSDLIPFNLSRWRKAAQFKIKCNDPDIPDDDTGFAPGEFGCKVIKYCIEDAQCNPADATTTYNSTIFDPRLNKTINITKTDLLTEKVLAVNSTKWVCYQSVDKGDNVEDRRCDLIRVDTTPPIIKITGTNPTLTSDGRTNSPTVSISGELINNAFFAESFAGMIPYAFVDYEFNALVSAEEVAEIRFNYIDAQNYDYLIFNFGDNSIIGKIGTQSISQSASIRGQKIPLKITRRGGTTTIDTIDLSQSYTSTDETSRILIQTGSWQNITVVDPLITSPITKLRIKLDNTTIIDEDATTPFSKSIPISTLITKPGFSGLIEVSAEDAAGNIGKETIRIIYDIVGPVSAPIIDPPITNMPNIYGENYNKLGYSLYYDGKDYYTNANQLWITGYTPEPLERIELVRVTPEGSESIVLYTENPVAFYKAPTGVPYSLRLKSTTNKGSANILVSGDITPYLNYFRDSFGGNVYISFVETAHHRTSYGNYLDYYNASSWSFDGRDTIITIEPSLEGDVAENEPFLLVNDSRANNRFKELISLIDNNINGVYGNNTVWINQYDDLGNSGRSLDRITIYVDKDAPVILSTIPSVFLTQDSITIKSISNITFKISESGFGIRDELDGGINLSVNGISKTFQKQLSSTGPSHNLSIFYKETLPDGKHNITLVVRDKSGNEIRRNWNVTIDSALPSYPEIKITNNVNISSAPDDYVFVQDGSKPEFSIFYPDYLAKVNLTSAVLINKTAGEAVIAGYELNCTNTGVNMYSCVMNQNIPSGNNDYSLRIRSQKVYTDGSLGPLATHYYYFAVDRTAPLLSNLRLKPTGESESYINSKSLLEYTINIENENHPLYAETIINGILVGNSTALVPTGTLTIAENISDLVLIDGETYPVESRICDYAGNCNSKTGAITIDDTSPRFTTNITIEAKPLFIVEQQLGNATYVVREDLISITGALEKEDTVAISLYRGNPKTTNPITTISECIGTESTNCILGNAFNFKGTTIVMGEAGKVEQNNIYLVAVDRAGNINDPPLQRIILKDVMKPAIQICVEGGLRCTVIEREEIPVITDTTTMKQKCGANSDCYDALIKKACEDLLEKGQVDSVNSCYKEYLTKLANPELWTLCEKTGLLRDTCIYDLAKTTKVASLCQNIIYGALQTRCIAEVTS